MRLDDPSRGYRNVNGISESGLHGLTEYRPKYMQWRGAGNCPGRRARALMMILLVGAEDDPAQ